MLRRRAYLVNARSTFFRVLPWDLMAALTLAAVVPVFFASYCTSWRAQGLRGSREPNRAPLLRTGSWFRSVCSTSKPAPAIPPGASARLPGAGIVFTKYGASTNVSLLEAWCPEGSAPELRGRCRVAFQPTCTSIRRGLASSALGMVRRNTPSRNWASMREASSSRLRVNCRR
jgi:hypothetical protein